MTDSRHTPDDALLQHYRQHNTGEPPASLDAFILNAARREAPKPAPNLWQRWLRACQQPRWQMAFASLAGVALLDIRVICSDQQEHQRRVETRTGDIPGLVPPSWESVLAHEYEDWDEVPLTVDTAFTAPEQAMAVILTDLTALAN